MVTPIHTIKRTLVTSVDPDQTPQKAAFDRVYNVCIEKRELLYIIVLVKTNKALLDTVRSKALM